MFDLFFDGGGDAEFVGGEGAGEVEAVVEVAAVHYYVVVTFL